MSHTRTDRDGSTDRDMAGQQAAGQPQARFGEIAVQLGLARQAQVQDALEIQRKLRAYGVTPKRLGEILVEKGVLDGAQVARILEVQRKRESERQIEGYELLELLGKGGMGSVYKARQISLDRIVALKVLPPRCAKDRVFIDRFIREARTVARLNHENIIAGIDVGESHGYYYFAMEFVEGETVAQVIERDGPVEERRALSIVQQVCRALAHAQKNGLVHRDVKPQNIMLARGDVAKLCDLGLAKTSGDDEDGHGGGGGGGGAGAGETKGVPLGTPHYISPEQARGESDVDIRSDIYSLGATLYHMLTGETPFVGQSPMVLMTKHLTEDPEPPRRRNPKVSKAASELVLHMMAKAREDRPQGPLEVLEELDRVLAGKAPARGSQPRKGPAARGGGSGGGGGGSGDASARTSTREAPPDNLSAYIDPDSDRKRERARARRQQQIRGTKKFESIGLAIAGVVILLVGIPVIVHMAAGPSRGVRDAGPAPSEDDEARARRALQDAAEYQRNHPRDTEGAIRHYEEVIDDHPGTGASRQAQLIVGRLRGEAER